MRIEGIAIREAKKAPMLEIVKGVVTTESGIVGDAGRKPGKFMVTLLSQEAWHEACAEVDRKLPWTTRRANILISGYRFSAADVGKTVSIGDCTLRITRETDPCDYMNAACPGLKQALRPDWRGGVRAKVESSGEISVGDALVIE